MQSYFSKNLYEILEIDCNADDKCIKAAYRRLARLYHPDVNPATEEKFKEITLAYEVLIDSEQKRLYDTFKGFTKKQCESQTRRTRQEYRTQSEKTQRDSDSNSGHKESSLHNASNSKEQGFSGVFDDILDGIFTSAKQKQTKKTSQKPQNPPPKNGSDIHTNVEISLSEAMHGTNRTINIMHIAKCPNCEGRRFINGTKCSLCKGSGEQSVHKKINVKIPPNIKSGTKIRIPNEANQGFFGGKNGDLYLTVFIENPVAFKTQGLNTLCDIPISPYEAALGASIEINTVNGRLSMKIPPSTTSGQKFRLPGEGITKNGKTGDMIATVHIEIPKDLTEEEIKLYEKLKTLDTRILRGELFENLQ